MAKQSEAELLSQEALKEAAALVTANEDAIRAQRKIKPPREINNVIRVEQSNMRVPLRKMVGHTIQADESKSKFYFARAKGLAFYITENEMLQFQNNAFFTDDAEYIEMLDTHPLNGIEFWAKALPEYIVEQRRRERDMYTRDITLYG